MEKLKLVLTIMSTTGLIITLIWLYAYIKKGNSFVLYLCGLFNGISLGLNIAFWLVSFIAN